MQTHLKPLALLLDATVAMVVVVAIVIGVVISLLVLVLKINVSRVKAKTKSKHTKAQETSTMSLGSFFPFSIRASSPTGILRHRCLEGNSSSWRLG